MEKEGCARCGELEKRLEVMQKQIDILTRRLLAYENAHTPPSLSKKKRPRDPPSGKLGAPEGHPRYERKDPEPTGSVEYVEETCPQCQSRLAAPFKTERFLEEEIPEPQPIEVIEHQVNHYECPACHKHIVARNNAPAGRFGKNALTHVTLLKYEDRLPLRKVVNSLERHYGLPLTNVGVLQITQRVTQRLAGPYQAIISRVRESRVVYSDETQIKVNGVTYWIWTFVTESETLFVIRRSRSKSVIEEILGSNFKGVISCDGWTAYSQYSTRLQRCWAHLLREAKALAEKYPAFAGLYATFKSMFERINQIRELPPSLEQRQKIATEMKLELGQIVTQMSAYQEFRKFATKITNGAGYWFTCLIDLFVEPTNNTAERALRELVVQRKIIGGLRREKGARIMETIASIVATTKQQGLPLFQTIKSYL